MVCVVATILNRNIGHILPVLNVQAMKLSPTSPSVKVMLIMMISIPNIHTITNMHL